MQREPTVQKPNIDYVLAKKKWDVNVPDFTQDVKIQPSFSTAVSTQTVRHTLRLHFIAAKAQANSNIAIWCSLENTNVSPGALVSDDDDHRGLFQDELKITLFLAKKDTGDELKPHPNFILEASGPSGNNGSGTVTSSVSFSFSPSFNGGFFGDVVTGGAGGGGGVSESHSFSHSYTDFETQDLGDGKVAQTRYYMALSQGAKYGKPSDLFNSSPGGFLRNLAGNSAPLYALPDLATSNLAVLSQALWVADSSDDFEDDIEIHVNLEHSLSYCGKTPSLGMIGQVVLPVPHTTIVSNHHVETIPLSELKKMADSLA